MAIGEIYKKNVIFDEIIIIQFNENCYQSLTGVFSEFRTWLESVYGRIAVAAA